MEIITISNLKAGWSVAKNRVGDLYAYDTKRFHLFSTKDLGKIELYPIWDGVVDYEFKAQLDREDLTPLPSELVLSNND